MTQQQPSNHIPEAKKMVPGDELHLTLLMAPFSLNFFTGQDRQHLLAFGRAAFEAGQAAAQQAVQAAVPVAWRLTNTAFRKPRFEYHDTKESAEQRQADFNRSVDDGGLHNLTPLYAAPAHPSEVVPAQAAVPEGWKLAPIKPTPEMCHVGRYGGDKDAPAYGEKSVEGATAWPFVADHTAEQIYQSMLAAAPAHPAEGVPATAAVAEPDERAAFEAWLRVKPCGAAHDFGWAAWRARAALAATQPAAQGMEEEAQRNADIGAAVMRACKELPEGAEIQIYLERGAGTVHMTDWDGNEFDHFDQDHEDFACRINAATDGAIAAEKVAAQAKQGGAA